MVKLLIGAKGSGKTKTLIELVNNAANTSNGSVVCIEKGTKLKLDITYKARLIDSDSYNITSAEALYGFVAGILASNSDITDVFVDGTLKICAGDVDAFGAVLPKIEAVAQDVNVVMTASVAVEECPESVKKYA